MALEPMDAFAEVEADPEYDSMLRRFWVSAALSLPVLLIAMFGDALKLPLTSVTLAIGSNSFSRRRSFSGAAGHFSSASGPRW